MTTNTVRESDLYTERGYRFRWMVMAVVIIADVMDLLDATIANLAGPSIRTDLGGSETTLQWVLTAYTAAFAIGLITSGRLGDLLGAAGCSSSVWPASPSPRSPADWPPASAS